jgi:hypothetical protein
MVVSTSEDFNPGISRRAAETQRPDLVFVPMFTRNHGSRRENPGFAGFVASCDNSRDLDGLK